MYMYVYQRIHHYMDTKMISWEVYGVIQYWLMTDTDIQYTHDQKIKFTDIQWQVEFTDIH